MYDDVQLPGEAGGRGRRKLLVQTGLKKHKKKKNTTLFLNQVYVLLVLCAPFL